MSIWKYSNKAVKYINNCIQKLGIRLLMDVDALLYGNFHITWWFLFQTIYEQAGMIGFAFRSE